MRARVSAFNTHGPAVRPQVTPAVQEAPAQGAGGRGQDQKEPEGEAARGDHGPALGCGEAPEPGVRPWGRPRLAAATMGCQTMHGLAWAACSLGVLPLPSPAPSLNTLLPSPARCPPLHPSPPGAAHSLEWETERTLTRNYKANKFVLDANAGVSAPDSNGQGRGAGGGASERHAAVTCRHCTHTAP